MNILISSAGRRVSLVRAFQKELKKIYPDAKVFAADANPVLSSACQIADGNFKVPRLNNDNYLSILIKECKQREISLLIPTIDTELLLLAQNKKVLKDNGIEAVISSEDFVQKCRDKREIHTFFDEKGVHRADEYEKDNYSLPLFIKPTDGSRSVDTFLIKSKDDFIPYHFENEKLMFLKYIDHELHDEFTCDMYFDKNHQLKTVVPRKRIEVRDGEVYKAVTSNNVLVPYLKDTLGHIEGARGCLTAQFFVHQTYDTIYGIEINPRFGGGYPLSYLAGANFPKWIIQEYMQNIEIEVDFNCWENNLLMIRYDDEILVHGYKG